MTFLCKYNAFGQVYTLSQELTLIKVTAKQSPVSERRPAASSPRRTGPSSERRVVQPSSRTHRGTIFSMGSHHITRSHPVITTKQYESDFNF